MAWAQFGNRNKDMIDISNINCTLNVTSEFHRLLSLHSSECSKQHDMYINCIN